MRLTRTLRRNLIKLLDTDLSQKLEHYAKFIPSPGIPVRLANIIKELELIPDILQQQVSFFVKYKIFMSRVCKTALNLKSLQIMMLYKILSESHLSLCSCTSPLHPFELLKNALRATIERHEDSPNGIPDVDVLVVKSPCDVTIKISDQGGGIPYSITDKLFQYMYTTAPSPSSNNCLGQTPIAGLGYGLPLSRLYARYFRGDVVLASQDGYGTDVTVYLRALSDEAYEYLPVYNHMTKLLYEKPRPLSCDWTDPTASLGSSRSAKVKFNNASHYNHASNFKNNYF
ncbi:PDK2_3_4 [Lepeophtheirus salmonis]|uniref:Protein-serine/threonine kinase n=1 Tax=Lepeophtheirus salmonis TaxID=72036 RepID=A0A7R8H855_LEPSM|nr:PDK2_3_4 [Lepeophtheirus salmonis]CAF2916732.1 PDK2_3_4 [Lepeophtheirus salmonis]